jgi:hypothetical protein
MSATTLANINTLATLLRQPPKIKTDILRDAYRSTRKTRSSAALHNKHAPINPCNNHHGTHPKTRFFSRLKRIKTLFIRATIPHTQHYQLKAG